MATTVFATVAVTVTATPPPTTVLITAPCTGPPAQVITTTHTAAKLPDEYPLHFFPPFLTEAQPSTALPTLTVTISPSAAEPSRAPSRVWSFPHGAAPETPDPLGVHRLPWYYGPGPSVLLNLVAIAAVLQLHLGPPASRTHGQPVGVDGLDPAVSKGKLATLLPPSRFKRYLVRVPTCLPSIPLLHLTILATLTGMNRATWDLLTAYISMERLRARPDPSWIAQAGAMGPPFTMLTWGLVAAIWRVVICLNRIRPESPRRYYGARSPDAVQKQRQKARIADHMRLLGAEGVGLVFPMSALAMLILNGWVWLGMTTIESKLDAAIPSDYIPGLFWDGMGTSGHAILVLCIAGTGLLCVALTALALLVLNEDFWEYCHDWVEKHICRYPIWKLWLGHCAVVGAGMALGLLVLLCLFVGVGEEYFQDLGDRYAEEIKQFWLWVLAPWAVVIFPMFILHFVLCFPFAILWYLLRGWVFGVLDVRRSSIFIPYTDTSVWQYDQLVLVALGIGLVVYSVRQIRHACMAEPQANLVRRRFR